MQIQFLKKYLTSLQSYISQPENINMAFQLGKEAIGNGLTILDMVEIHQIALDALLCSQTKAEESRKIVQQTWAFFQESLAAYDVNPYQYQNTNATLQQISHSKDQKIVEQNKELLKERAFLAKRVDERTAELSRTNAELSRAVRLKDEFLATMSHELRSPLNTILASAEILLEQDFGPLNEKQFKYVHNLDESARHLLNLINDILDLSKIEAGKMILQLESVSVAEICENSLAFVKELALKKKLQIILNIDKAVKIIHVDSLRLKQILINLLSNAVKFSNKEKNKIGLDVIANKEKEAVHFTVWDTGIGIAKSDIPKLFQSFVQIDASLARLYEGTGLGLALVRRLAEMHGGSVSVKSEVGKGSRFTVSLPWQEKYQTLNNIKIVNNEESEPIQLMKQHPDAVILLVEDNENNIVCISDYFRFKGYKVFVARNGKEAIESAKEKHPNIILMDIQMPIMNGLEAIRQIRADSDLSNIPIIALTALAMPGDKKTCLAAGADEYLTKPVHLRGLVKLIETHLEVNK